MGIFSTIRLIISHPLSKRMKVAALKRWLKWQIGSRLVPGGVAVTFVNDAKLLVQPGMTGATGNIYLGLHEFENMSFVLHMLRKNDLFVDIGANIGSYTILASAVVGAKCISIEPIPATYNHLLNNINLNGVKDLVNSYNLGIGQKNGTLNFTSDNDTTNHVLDERRDTSNKVVEVEVKSLDNLIGSLAPKLLKIDVEGYENAVIEGARKVLSSDALDAVIMELNGSGDKYGYDEIALHKKMTDYGFKPFIYNPFERKLISLNGKNVFSDNTLYLRNIESISKRLSTSEAFRVNGLSI